MAASTYRTVTVSRGPHGVLHATNVRGGTLVVGAGDGDGFTPSELLMVALGSCTAADVDALTSRRAEPASFEVQVEADKVRDEAGNRLANLVVTFRVVFPDGETGDAARAVLPEAVKRSHDRLCTVGRTIESGCPVTNRVEG
ncbi:MAG: OsmC family protein [Sporichthyaceae bacterium]